MLFSKSSTIREIAIHVKHVVGHVIFSKGSFSKWFLDSVYIFGVNGNYHHEENETHRTTSSRDGVNKSWSGRERNREKGMMYGRKMTEIINHLSLKAASEIAWDFMFCAVKYVLRHDIVIDPIYVSDLILLWPGLTFLLGSAPSLCKYKAGRTNEWNEKDKLVQTSKTE